jgi:hypothetical protein
VEPRSFRPRHGKRSFLIVVGSLVATLALSANALGFDYTIPLSRLSSGTGATMNWKGESGVACAILTEQQCADGQLRGTAVEGWSLFREVEGDSNYDYYIAQTFVTWKLTGGGDMGQGNAPGWIQIWSNKPAVGGPVYDGNGSASAPLFGCASLSVGAQLGFFSISANPTLCNDASLNMTTLDATNAIWRSNLVQRTPKWDVWYAIKVAAGVKPTLNFTLTFPVFTIHTRSHAVPTYDKVWYSYSISAKVP